MALENGVMPVSVIRTGDQIVTCLCFLPSAAKSKRLLVTGTDCGNLVVWNLKTQTIQETKRVSHTTVLSAILTKGPSTLHSRLLVYTRDQKLLVLTWNDHKLEIIKESHITDSLCPTFCGIDVTSSPWSDDVTYIAVPRDKSVCIYTLLSTEDTPTVCDIEATGCIMKMAAMVTCIRACHTDRSGFMIIIGDEAGLVTMYNLKGGDNSKLTCIKLCSLNTQNSEPVITLDYLSITCTGVSAGASGLITVLKYSTTQGGKSEQDIDKVSNDTSDSKNTPLPPTQKSDNQQHQEEQHQLTVSCKIETPCKGFNMIKLRHDSKLFVACSWDGTVRLHGPKRGKILALSEFHRESVTCVCFDEDDRFVTASRDRILCCWDLYSRVT